MTTITPDFYDGQIRIIFPNGREVRIEAATINYGPSGGEYGHLAWHLVGFHIEEKDWTGPKAPTPPDELTWEALSEATAKYANVTIDGLPTFRTVIYSVKGSPLYDPRRALTKRSRAEAMNPKAGIAAWDANISLATMRVKP